MRISIDFSVSTKSGQSLGHVSGEIEVSEEPRIGSLFELPAQAAIDPDIGLPSAILIEDVIHPSDSSGPDLNVALQDVIIDKAHSFETMDSVFELQMGLYWNPHDLR